MENSQSDIAARISERQMRLWNVLRSAERHAFNAEENARKSRYRFLTLSRDTGSLGDEIARELAARLGWHMFDREIVDDIAENAHARENIVRQLDEKSQGFVHEAILRLLQMPERTLFGAEEYHESLMKTLATLATRGDAILVGRGANFALRWLENGMHVRITGSIEVRARRARQIWQMPAGKTRQRLLAADADRRRFIRHHYRKDFDDLRGYDLTLNTDHLSVEQAASAIIAVMAPETPMMGTRFSSAPFAAKLNSSYSTKN